ncbi:MAG: pilus assembly protein PilM [Acidobacteria bacterium]|nr:pilus assembly protein PilM [Acidobacteriota bacterium]
MFKRNTKKNNLVGLDIGSSSVKAVELQGKLGSLVLLNLAHESLQPDSVVDGQIMELNSVSQTIASIFQSNQIKTERVAAGVSGSSVIVKNIIVPPMSEAELEESIDWHAEEHIPFDIADVSLDYQIVGSNADSLSVLMAACKRDFVANIKQAIQLAGKEPVIIDVDAFALQNCYEVNYDPQPNQAVALLNIGASTMNINIVQGTRSVFTRDVSVGGNQYTSLLQKELYRATSDDGEGAVQKILVSGGGSKLPGLADFLTNRFEIPVEHFDPFRNIKIDARRFDPEYLKEVVPEMAVAVGLALRGVEA